MNSLVRWRHLIAYGILAVAVVGAFVGYQRHVDGEFRKADRLSCANRTTLIRNQRIVLGFLARNTQHLAAVASPERAYFLRTHQRIDAALAELDRTPTCQEARNGN